MGLESFFDAVLLKLVKKKKLLKIIQILTNCPCSIITCNAYVSCVFRVGGVVERGAAKLYPQTEVALSLILLFGKRTKLPSEALCLIARSSKAM